jgi:hypothetical protein
MAAKGGIALVLAVLATGAAGGAPPKDTSRSMLTPGGLTSAEVCTGCHKDIHAAWSDSVHARSLTNPAFAAALAALKGSGPERAACLSCHAPATLVSKNAGIDDPLVREGITCSFCHAITGAKDKWSMDMFTVDPGQTMRGPFKFAESPGHFTEYSPLHKTALLCAPCHQFTNAKGVAVLATYDEWKAGPWPRQGVQCQDCHMALVQGAVAEDIAKPAQESAQDRRLINLHRLVGGSALGQLRRSLTATIKRSRREQGTIKLDVDVKNDAAGHRAPTGLPTRSIVLKVTASRDGKSFFKEERVYRRTLLDAAGKRITRDADAFSSAVKVGADTRIAPGEARFERFSIPAPPGIAKVEVSLEYVRGPGADGGAGARQVFQELSVEVP